MTDSAMAKLIPFPIDRAERPLPSCECCGEDYAVSAETSDHLCLSHSCDMVPFDERLIRKADKEMRSE